MTDAKRIILAEMLTLSLAAVVRLNCNRPDRKAMIKFI